ncbi:hypothetical protein JMN32_05165 [Fulvivirga sp. 29W222]|uniref:Uncharacterized protein n=1 Tax=Fulvivirga marina TaxID=2494733 RepID=A0A937FVG7_9BACT|nr:hypothetical protein [Fulvivirga marina]MBL6445687.1 hypothetical protein [Fulvivirga marina]
MKIFQKINRTNDNDIDRMFSDLVKEKPEYFGENEKIIYPSFPTVSNMMNKMLSDTKKSNNPSINLAFHYYDQFSKYEHLGDLTTFLIMRPFTHQNNTDQRYKELVDVVRIVTETMVILTTPWDEFYKGINNKRNELLQEINL